MERTFVEEIGEVDGETEFHIVNEPYLGSQGSHLGRWIIQRPTLVGGVRRYIFQRVGGEPGVSLGPAYLRPKSLSGSYVLLGRRLKAIEALRDQTAMLVAMETPGSGSRDTMEELVEDASMEWLDEKKRLALHAIWRTQPMFVLQGPPGTGKTALIENMVRRSLELDPSLQFLATAQANATVDNLGLKLLHAIGGKSPEAAPLIVRLDEEDDEEQSAIAPARLSGEIAARLVASELGQLAPSHIRQRLTLLNEGSGQAARREQNDMVRLISRAANVVLATTTSPGLSELLDEGKRFDWSLVEEAGKAHGFDLALPMLASHRMLMAGDHEQLPAFNARSFSDLLADAQKTKEALRIGAPFIPRHLGFDLESLDSQDSEEELEARCARWLPMVRTFGHIFEGAIALPAVGSPIAVRLNEQHRMHPEICDLVRSCFYPDLKTADVARKRLSLADTFELSDGSWLPRHRIPFVDLPWIQSTPNAIGQDVGKHGRMLLSSAVEAEAVVSVIGQIIPRGQCELQGLAPYNRQVRVVRNAIADAESAGRLPSLSKFKPSGGANQLGATIDGFQGEEADVIIVSLVRNNDVAPPGGVGFLSERPRLNVMLSRARRKLVLVGCWEFFLKRANDEAWKDPYHPLHHIANVFHELESAIRNGTACKVSYPGTPA
jgi:DNA polymerase III delta prime subunit